MILLVLLQCLWSVTAGVMVALMWRWRREGERRLEAARTLHDATEAHLTQCVRAMAAAKRAGVDLEQYMHDA